MKKQVFVILLTLIYSCKTIKFDDKTTSVIDVLIEDYVNSNKKYTNQYKFYEIEKVNYEENCLYFYRFEPSLNNCYTPTISDSLYDIYPTHYKIYKGKIFFWRNSKKEIPSEKMLNFLDSLGLIDSSYLKFQLGEIEYDSVKMHMVIKDDGLETVNYIICKNNPQKVKKKVKVPAYYYFGGIVKKTKCKCNKSLQQ